MTIKGEEKIGMNYSGLLPGEQLLADLYSLVQATKIYQENNQLVLDGVENFRRSVSGMSAEAEVLEFIRTCGTRCNE